MGLIYKRERRVICLVFLLLVGKLAAGQHATGFMKFDVCFDFNWMKPQYTSSNGQLDLKASFLPGISVWSELLGNDDVGLQLGIGYQRLRLKWIQQDRKTCLTAPAIGTSVLLRFGDNDESKLSEFAYFFFVGMEFNWVYRLKSRVKVNDNTISLHKYWLSPEVNAFQPALIVGVKHGLSGTTQLKFFSKPLLSNQHSMAGVAQFQQPLMMITYTAKPLRVLGWLVEDLLSYMNGY